MPKCSAFGCRNRPGGDQSNKPPDVSFHSFPLQNPRLLKEWLHNIGREDFVPNKFSKLCSIHFLPDCFKEDVYATYGLHAEEPKKKRGRFLREGAVPIQFSHRTSLPGTERASPVAGREKRETEMQISQKRLASDAECDTPEATRTSAEDHQKSEGPYPAVLFKRIKQENSTREEDGPSERSEQFHGSVVMSSKHVAVSSNPLPSYLQGCIFPSSLHHLVKLKGRDSVSVKSEPLEYSQPESSVLKRGEHKDLTCLTEQDGIFPVKLGRGGIVPPETRQGGIVSVETRQGGIAPRETKQDGVVPRETKQGGIVPPVTRQGGIVPPVTRQGGIVPPVTRQGGIVLSVTRQGGIVPREIKQDEQTGQHETVPAGTRLDGVVPVESSQDLNVPIKTVQDGIGSAETSHDRMPPVETRQEMSQLEKDECGIVPTGGRQIGIVTDRNRKGENCLAENNPDESVPTLTGNNEIVLSEIQKSDIAPVEISQCGLKPVERGKHGIFSVEVEKVGIVQVETRQGKRIHAEARGRMLPVDRGNSGIVPAETEKFGTVPEKTSEVGLVPDGPLEEQNVSENGVQTGGASTHHVNMTTEYSGQDGILLPTEQDGVYFLQAEEEVLNEIQNGEDGIFFVQNKEDGVDSVLSGPEVSCHEVVDSFTEGSVVVSSKHVAVSSNPLPSYLQGCIFPSSLHHLVTVKGRDSVSVKSEPFEYSQPESSVLKRGEHKDLTCLTEQGGIFPVKLGRGGIVPPETRQGGIVPRETRQDEQTGQHETVPAGTRQDSIVPVESSQDLNIQDGIGSAETSRDEMAQVETRQEMSQLEKDECGIVPADGGQIDIVPERKGKGEIVPAETEKSDITPVKISLIPVETGKHEILSVEAEKSGIVQVETRQGQTIHAEARSRMLPVDRGNSGIVPAETEKTSEVGLVPDGPLEEQNVSENGVQTGGASTHHVNMTTEYSGQDGILLPTEQDGVYFLQAEEEVLNEIQNGEDGIFYVQNKEDGVDSVFSGPEVSCHEVVDSFTENIKEACGRDHCYIRAGQKPKKKKEAEKVSNNDPAIKYLTEEIDKLDCRRVAEGRRLCAQIRQLQALVDSQKTKARKLQDQITEMKEENARLKGGDSAYLEIESQVNRTQSQREKAKQTRVKYGHKLVRKLLKERTEHIRETEKLKSMCLTVKLVKNNKQLCKRYTGFPNYTCLRDFFQSLKQKSTFSVHRKAVWGQRRRISLEEEFLISLIKLKTKMPFFDLARQFGLTSSRVSDTVLKWAHILQDSLGQCSDNLEYPCSEDIRSWVQRYINKHERSKNFISVDTSQSDISSITRTASDQ